MKNLEMKQQLTEMLELDDRFIISNVVKNGYNMKSIRLSECNSNIIPTLYIDDSINYDDSLTNIIDGLYDSLIQASNSTPDIANNLDSYLTKDFIFDNVNCFLSGKSDLNNNLLKSGTTIKELDEILEYIYYINLSADMKVNLNYEILEHAGINNKSDIAEIQMRALGKLAKEEFFIKNMAQVLCEMIPDMEFFDDEDEMPMYVLMNESGKYAASHLIEKSLLNKFMKEHNMSRIAILPSSLHELIILNANLTDDTSSLLNMVKEVNNNEVDIQDKLGDFCLLYDGNNFTVIKEELHEN